MLTSILVLYQTVTSIQSTNTVQLQQFQSSGDSGLTAALPCVERPTSHQPVTTLLCAVMAANSPPYHIAFRAGNTTCDLCRNPQETTGIEAGEREVAGIAFREPGKVTRQVLRFREIMSAILNDVTYS